MKKYFVIVLMMLVSAVVFSHEFWLQPVKFLVGINEKTSVSIFVGEGYKGEKVDAAKYKVVRLKHFSAAGEADFSGSLNPKDQTMISAKFSTAGNHLLAFNNSNKFLSLKSSEFNAYLKEEGLDDIYEMRLASNDTAKDSREFYQRCVKTLLMVGNKADSSYKVNTGMRLELIPSSNPYSIAKTDKIGFEVLFDNMPVKNALVLAWNVVDNKTSVNKYRTDAEGIVSFPVSRKGRWMISTVKMIPYTETGDADWQSFWGSYTFGFY